MRIQPLVWVVLMAWALSVPVAAEDWPQFRGPTGQGISQEKKLPIHWNGVSNVLWKTMIPGEGWSSPIVWDTRVFVTAAAQNGISCRVLCLDSSSGRVLWDREAFQQAIGRKEARNSFATPTPATDGARVYTVFYDGSFAALDFNGSLLWTNRQYPFYGQHGLGTSPILFEDLLIMARDGSSQGEDKQLGWQKPWDQSFLLALDTKLGQHRWKSGRGLSRIGHVVPCIWTAPDGRAQVISGAGGVVQGFYAKTSERIWSSFNKGEGVVPPVVTGEGLVFTASGFSGRESVKAFRLDGQGDLQETNLVWEQRKGMPKVPSLLYVKPSLYYLNDGGVALCLEGGTGKIVWEERLDSNFSASPVYADGRIYWTLWGRR